MYNIISQISDLVSHLVSQLSHFSHWGADTVVNAFVRVISMVPSYYHPYCAGYFFPGLFFIVGGFLLLKEDWWLPEGLTTLVAGVYLFIEVSRALSGG
jgi:hypothetical protein